MTRPILWACGALCFYCLSHHNAAYVILTLGCIVAGERALSE